MPGPGLGHMDAMVSTTQKDLALLELIVKWGRKRQQSNNPTTHSAVGLSKELHSVL